MANAAANDAPAPAWFHHLATAFAIAAVISLVVFFGCSMALRRRPAELRAQAATLDIARLRQSRRARWYRRAIQPIYWAALWLAAPLMIGSAAIFGGPLAINGLAYLFGAGQVFAWSDGMQVHSVGGAFGALALGLLFVGGAIL